MLKKAETSTISIVVAIIVLLVVALALIVVSTSSVSDLGNRVHVTMGKLFHNKDQSNNQGGIIDQVIDRVASGYSSNGNNDN